MALGVSTEKVVVTPQSFKGFNVGGSFVASNRDEPFVLTEEDGRFVQHDEDGYSMMIFVLPDDLMLTLVEHFPDILFCHKQEDLTSFSVINGKLKVSTSGEVVLGDIFIDDFNIICNESTAKQMGF